METLDVDINDIAAVLYPYFASLVIKRNPVLSKDYRTTSWECTTYFNRFMAWYLKWNKLIYTYSHYLKDIKIELFLSGLHNSIICNIIYKLADISSYKGGCLLLIQKLMYSKSSTDKWLTNNWDSWWLFIE